MTSTFGQVVLISIIIYGIAYYFDLSERFYTLAHHYEGFELDELVTVILFLAIYFALVARKENKKNIALLAESKRISEIDYLTGLNNRRMMNGYLKQLIEEKVRYGTAFSIILFDIDHFKKINDTYGHAVGDEVLKAISKTIQLAIRGSDIVGRWGGEEFLALCPNTNREGALIIAEKLRKSIELMQVKDLPTVTASFGVAFCHKKDIKIDEVLIKVDELLYKAKDQGRNCIVIE